MKKVKIVKLFTNIVKVGAKSKVITLGVVIILVCSTIGVIKYYKNNDNNNLPELKIVGTDEYTLDKEVAKTKEEKEKDDKQIELNSLKDEIKKLDPEADINKSENDLDKDLEYYKKIKYEIEENIKQKNKDNESEKSDEAQLENDIENDSNLEKKESKPEQTQDSTQQVAQNPEPQVTQNQEPQATENQKAHQESQQVEVSDPQQVETTEPKTKIRPVDGYQSELSDYVFSQLAVGRTNKPSGVITQNQLDLMNSLVSEWYNGSGETMSSINSKVKEAYLNETNIPLELATLKIFTIPYNDNKDVIAETVGKNRAYFQKGFLFIRISYDSSSDLYTVHLAAGD